MSEHSGSWFPSRFSECDLLISHKGIDSLVL